MKEIGLDKMVLASGKELPAGAVVLAIGVTPETALAKEAGLAIGSCAVRVFGPNAAAAGLNEKAAQAALVALNLLCGKIRQVPVTAVRKLVEEGAAIIDVREPTEYAAGHQPV